MSAREREVRVTLYHSPGPTSNDLVTAAMKYLQQFDNSGLEGQYEVRVDVARPESADAYRHVHHGSCDGGRPVRDMPA